MKLLKKIKKKNTILLVFCVSFLVVCATSFQVIGDKKIDFPIRITAAPDSLEVKVNGTEVGIRKMTFAINGIQANLCYYGEFLIYSFTLEEENPPVIESAANSNEDGVTITVTPGYVISGYTISYDATENREHIPDSEGKSLIFFTNNNDPFSNKYRRYLL